MAVTLIKVKNPQARPITFASQVRCMHWAGCGRRASHIIPKFMGVIKVCASHAG